MTNKTDASVVKAEPPYILNQVEKKIEFFKNVIQKTIIHVQRNKMQDILGIIDVNNCVEKMEVLGKKIEQLTDKNTDNLINNLQTINNELSSLLKNYGTDSLEDLLTICFGNNSKIIGSEKFELLKKYFHPTSYKVVANKKDVQETLTISCSELNQKKFYMDVNGLKIYIHSSILNKSLIIFGIMDNVVIDILNDNYVTTLKEKVTENIPDIFNKETFGKFLSCLMLKDYLISNNESDIYEKYAGQVTQNNNLKNKQVSQIVKDFIADDTFNKRNTLINLLIFSSNHENQYLAYLLYDLLSNEKNEHVDTKEQTLLFDSFPWPAKQYFKCAMKRTIEYTNQLTNFDINKIPIEQQICLLKAPDSVKEKAMLKLKEVKAKTEDTGSKARQYLDGLLKIPFNTYKREPILDKMNIIKTNFKNMCKKNNIDIPIKDKYTNVEIINYIKKIDSNTLEQDTDKINKINKIKEILMTGNKKKLIENIILTNKLIKKHTNITPDINYNLLNKTQLKEEVEKFIDLCKTPENKEILKETTSSFDVGLNDELVNNSDIQNKVSALKCDIKEIKDYMSEVKTTLDEVVYGHDNAKKQIERIIGQWINGDVTENFSHVLGFEGNPGIGKTTLAKGLANCLKDDKGLCRPFALIALGGDSNASTLLGHSYTYVGSNYGSIVQILIDKKCMNPIILFDEVDKISKTENGKEIVGVLTHLLDTTQNNSFQDKYFSGIDLDLSKALFILSYNDPECIDKILLDRVHRIKFDSLSVEDKIIISKKHLLPDLYRQIGLEDTIYFSDEVLKFIIEEYTLEPGVRKLKEKLFEIIGDINLDTLKNDSKECDYPISITIDDIKNKYFKDKREVKVYKIHSESKIGVINALWANNMAQGGVLPIQASFVPASKFLDLTLTGSLGEVMKESINVSLTNAWNLTCPKRQKYLLKTFNDKKNNNTYGIHIHCPDISTKKDGPSATTAFTILIYSLFNDIKIKNNVGITGETHFGLDITEIGGLQEKIIHSIKSGVTEFIFPKENQKDFIKIMKKYGDNKILEGIKFHEVQNIEEVFNIILEK